MVPSPDSTKKETRSKSYATLIYPESAKEDWKRKLESLMIPALISPIHDRDMLEDGSPKKAHYHVLLLYPSQKSTDQAKGDISIFGGVGCEKVKNAAGYARYLIHMDNPEKAQYNASEVEGLCGATIERYLASTADRFACMREMICFVRENGMICYADLVDYAEESRPDWFKVLCDSRTFLQDYMRSMAWKAGENNG